MADCSVCLKQFTFFENLTQRVIQRCKDCDQRLKQLQQTILGRIEYDFRQQGIFPSMEQDVSRQFAEMRMPTDLGQPVILRLRYLSGLTNIRNGNVPRIMTSIHLDSDEYAHFDLRVTYFKPLKTVRQISGRLIGTNKKCYFLADSGKDNATIDWNNVVQVDESTHQVLSTIYNKGKPQLVSQTLPILHVSVTRGSGGGDYSVPDSFYTKILIDTIVRMWKRQLVIYAETKTHGAVPDHVKAAVFQRDRGHCVQCGYEGPYIEYDHRIPRSKGGQNTVDNIQLLCRMCNLKKSDRL